MRGQHKVVVRNNKVQIKLLVQRNITILQGNSATGKTTLIDLIGAYDQFGSDSGAVVNCDVPCKVLSGRNWERDLSYIECSDFFSWEQFFTAELVECSQETYLAYRKSKLNEAYLGEGEFRALKDTLPDLGI